MKWLRTLTSNKEDTLVVLQGQERKAKVEKAAEDFAVRFERVMKDLANS